jgi:hypothetical protein
MNKILKRLFFTFIFLLLFVGLPYFLFSFFKQRRLHNPKYDIQIIIQTGPEKEALKSIYLAELMHLSVDQKTNIYAFDVQEAEKNLLKSPLIESAKVKKYPPNVIYVDYTVRRPLAWIYDHKNIAVDKNGYLFPISPFFPPKNIAEIYLGESLFSGKDRF